MTSIMASKIKLQIEKFQFKICNDPDCGGKLRKGFLDAKILISAIISPDALFKT